MADWDALCACAALFSLTRPSPPALWQPLVTPRPGDMSARSDTVPKLMLAEEAPKKKGERGRVQVQNLSVHRVATTEDVMRLIQRAQERRRAVGLVLVFGKGAG